MYRIAILAYAVEWFAVTVLASTYVFVPVIRKMLSGEGPHGDPIWPTTLPPLLLLLALPLYLTFRRSRAFSVRLEPDFERRPSVPLFVGMFLIFVGLVASACMLALPILPLGLSALAAPVWVLGGVASLFALGTGLLLVEVLHVLWLKKTHSNKAMQPTCETHAADS